MKSREKARMRERMEKIDLAATVLRSPLIQGMIVTINSTCYSFIRSSRSVFVSCGSHDISYSSFHSLLFQLFLIPFFSHLCPPPSNLINILPPSSKMIEKIERDEHVAGLKESTSIRAGLDYIQSSVAEPC